jgi:Flp pilus assembly protein TadG
MFMAQAMHTGSCSFTSSRYSRGQSVVELAIALPLLVLLFAGIVDVGRSFQAYISVTNAVREGARYASFYPSSDTDIATRVQREVAGTNVTIGTITIQPSDPAQRLPGTTIRIEVQYSVNTILGSILRLSPIRMRTAAQMIVF